MVSMVRGLKDADSAAVFIDAGETLNQFFKQTGPPRIRLEPSFVSTLRLLEALHRDAKKSKELREAAAEAWGSLQAFRVLDRGESAPHSIPLVRFH
jgi:hypothetical protein